MRMPIAIPAVAMFLLGVPRGPFTLEIPVDGLMPMHQRSVERVLLEKELEWGGVYKVECREGVLSFATAGQSERSLFYLSQLRDALLELDLTADPETWILKPQMLAVAVEGEEPVDLDLVAPSLPGARAVVQHEQRTLLVVELERETPYAELRQALASAGVRVDDLVWGHWRYGWGIEEQEDVAHVFGARPGPR